jgi:molecular chaperone DnaK
MHPLGIDLGTTYSAVSKWVSSPRYTGADPYTLPLEGGPTLPSKVFVEEADGGGVRFLVGRNALKQGILRPGQLVSAVKRRMDDAGHAYQILGHTLGPIDISAEILKSLLGVVDSVEAPGRYVPAGVVVTVPHYFRHHQNANTFAAALKAMRDLYAGREVAGGPESLMLGLLAEPIAVGLDYAFGRDGGDVDETVLVFDLGGGTFDVTVATLHQHGRELKFRVHAIEGNDRLGGEDFDASLLRWVLEANGIDLQALGEADRNRALHRILPVVAQEKEALSDVLRTDMAVAGAVGARHLEQPVLRADLERCLSGQAGDGRDYRGEVADRVDAVLSKAGLRPQDVTWVLMAGGSSRIPLFKQVIDERFGAGKRKDSADVHTAVSRGAAIYAAYLLDERLQQAGQPRRHLTLWDRIGIEEVTAHKLGIELNGRFLEFLGDSKLTPCSKTKFFEPTAVSADGSRVSLRPLRVVQGHASDYVPVGEVQVDDIHLHGRRREDVRIGITLTAHRNLVKVRVDVKGGSADGGDYAREGTLALGAEAADGNGGNGKEP